MKNAIPEDFFGIALAKASSIPIGSIETEHMYPLDFEEFLWANGFNEFSIQGIRNRFLSKAGLDEPMHAKMMENKKKRIVANKIESKKAARLSNYQDEFECLTNAGVALEVSAITDVKFPLIESSTKNLLKLYLNDVGILTGVLYGSNISAVLNDVPSINLGAVYETVVAQELKAHGKKLFYYDNRHKGEVDFLIDDFDSLSVVPIEVKSGRDYRIHSAIDNLLKTNENAKGIVLSNSSKVVQKGSVLYLPIYFVMFL